MSSKINAKIVADSISEQGHRITTFVLTYPRIIHAEVMTHRLFSRNAASSRAIPFKKMMETVTNDPFVPIAWQKDHKGMQGSKYETDPYYIEQNKHYWLKALEMSASSMNVINMTNKVTKQLCNRLLEPFQWYTCLVTVTELENFYNLRCPKLYHAANGNTYNSIKDWNKVDPEIQYEGLSCLHPENSSQAEIHIQALAEAMWDQQQESIPQLLAPGEWHIPFGDKFDISKLKELEEKYNTKDRTKLAIKIATARAARLSYMTFDGEIDYTKDIQLHDILLNSKHMSPFEHCARVMTTEEYPEFIKGRCYREEWNQNYIEIPEEIEGWCNNFKGFIQYRYLIENGKYTS